MTNLDLITNAFDRRDRKKLWIPQYLLEDKELEITPVITWMHNKFPFGYMIYNDGDQMTGISLTPTSPSKQARPRASMCDFCLQGYSSSQIQMFTYQKTPTLSVSFYICSDLGCEKRIIDPNFSKLHSTRETLSKPEKIARYHDKVRNFFLEHVQRGR